VPIEFTICPEFAFRRTSRRRRVASPAESGAILRRSLAERELRTWRLRWNRKSAPLVAYVRSIWTQARGAVLPITWTPVGESAVVVRFAAPSFDRVFESGPNGSVEIEFEEVR
jgi:hypothetical protein